MATPTNTVPAKQDIVASGVSADNYMAEYAETFHEWVKGSVIKMSPASLRHTLIAKYLMKLFDDYFARNPIGQVLNAPFVMRLETIESYREPDLQIILNDNPGQLTDTGMIGPADICIEIVSPESVERDYGQKFAEYEQAGVREYWIIDPIRERCDFNRRTDADLYAAIKPDDGDTYRTPLLPKLVLHVPTLWQDPLPDSMEIARAVAHMVEDAE